MIFFDVINNVSSTLGINDIRGLIQLIDIGNEKISYELETKSVVIEVANKRIKFKNEEEFFLFKSILNYLDELIQMNLCILEVNEIIDFINCKMDIILVDLETAYVNIATRSDQMIIIRNKTDFSVLNSFLCILGREIVEKN